MSFATLYTEIMYVITAPAEAVAKYCNEYVCVSVCVFVCMSVFLKGYLRNHMRDLYQTFLACCLSPWLGSPPAE